MAIFDLGQIVLGSRFRRGATGDTVALRSAKDASDRGGFSIDGDF